MVEDIMGLSTPPTTCDKAVLAIEREHADDLAHLLSSDEVCRPPSSPFPEQ